MKISTLIAIVLIGFMSAVSAQDKKVVDPAATPASMTITPAAPVASPAAAPNPNAPDFKFNEEEFNFGTIKQGESVTHEYTFINSGKEPLIITSAAGSCGCTVPDYPKQAIMKGEKATIKVTFNSAGKVGMQDKTVTINSNAKTNPKTIRIKGNVEAPPKAPDAAPAVPSTPAGGVK